MLWVCKIPNNKKQIPNGAVNKAIITWKGCWWSTLFFARYTRLALAETPTRAKDFATHLSELIFSKMEFLSSMKPIFQLAS